MGLIAVALAAIWCAGCGGGDNNGSSSSSPPTGAAPSASFTVSPPSPSAGQTVTFTDTTAGSPTSWSWNFGDGGTSSSQNPTHVFATAGTFTVTLAATNARGSSTATSSVAVASADSKLRILLGRPTDASIVANVLADAGTDVYLEYGTAPGTYSGTTAVSTIAGTSPAVVAVGGLAPDTQYYYRARWRARAETEDRAEAEHAFHTKRFAGSGFTFVIQADPHMDQNSSDAVYKQTLLNELADRPDFMVDLGDTSMSEKCAIDGTTLCASPNPPTQEKVWARNALMRSYFDLVGHSVPLFMVLGNHDGEQGWQDTATKNTVGLWSISARKTLFVNPEPGGIYTGNLDQVSGTGLLQDYYAFEWGDALIVVLDPFTYTTSKPTSGQEQSYWNWTLGATQYQWLARTLSSSRARYKFVFSHHLVGGNGSEARGGSEFARFYEWGGRNLDGTWAFDKQRPGWGKPIHQLLVDSKVTAWFHGHDHLYAMEQADGVVYQEVPQPSLARYDTADPGSSYGYKGTVGSTVFPSSGHLRVTVSSGEVRVEYMRSVAAADETATRKNGTLVHGYTVR